MNSDRPRQSISEIVIATTSKWKLAELRSVGIEFGLSLVSPIEIAQRRGLGPLLPPEEDGTTYRENALLKAQVCYDWCQLPSLGDDSGLEVFALGGRPGVHSARYAGEGASDDDRITKLLAELGTNEDRRAQYCCSLALILSPSQTLFAESQMPGRILESKQGAGGFGYDPIVLIDELGKTLAEIDFAATCQHGFRPVAARKLFAQL